MSARLLQIFWLLLQFVMLTSCSQAEPSPTPEPVLELADHFSDGRWILLELQVADQAIDAEFIRPAYLSFLAIDEPLNSVRVTIQATCSSGSGTLLASNYLMHFLSADEFEMIGQDTHAVGCPIPLYSYFMRLISSLTSYTAEDDTLILQGTDKETGDEIIVRWERDV